MALRFKSERFITLCLQKHIPFSDIALRVGVPLDVIDNYAMGAMPGEKALNRIKEILDVPADELIEQVSADQAGLVWTPGEGSTWDQRTPV